MTKPAQNERIEFYFPRRVSKLLRELIPARERSRMVAEATEKELQRRVCLERLQELKRLDLNSHHSRPKPRWKAPENIRQR